MLAGIYDPYLDTLGGGERYCLTVAEILAKHGYHVDVFWSGDSQILNKAQDRFSLNLKNINLVPDIFDIPPQTISPIHNRHFLHRLIKYSHSYSKFDEKIKKMIQKFRITRQYDVFFFLSDGSSPFLFGKKNILHFQVPFSQETLTTWPLIKPIKTLFLAKIICNSQFTAKFIQPYFSKKIDVVYPPVDITKFSPADNKKNLILSVGRFDNILNAKKQDELIDAFRHLVKIHRLANWNLIFAGGSLQQPTSNYFLQYLIKKSENLPIEFIVNPSFSQLKELYSKGKIYWHAAGFGVDENSHPEETEHFGMTIVEAMASGLVPVAVAKGGIPEIIDDSINGFLWKSLKGLTSKTLRLIKDPKLFNQMQAKALLKAKQFSKENFEETFIRLVKIK
ncbi:MAG TPA: glycosyltransferase family 4 protein [Candidatus Woesebacteria bacterium]|nr:glycosyltransferase family 4 protein [Candidatus Woesebacteria bacterium]